MAKSKRAYDEGTWFLVPLDCGGYGLGLLARHNNRGTILAYYFDRHLHSRPELDQLTALTAADAIVIGRSGDLSLLKGRWPVLGRLTAWDRTAWPLPEFGRIDALEERLGFRVRYSEQTLSEVTCTPTSAAEIRHLPQAAMYGDRAVEIRLTHKLAANCALAGSAAPGGATNVAASTGLCSANQLRPGKAALAADEPPDPADEGAEQAVLLVLPMRADGEVDFDWLGAFEDALQRTFDDTHAGECDGNELGGGEIRVFCYGPSADRLFDAIEPILRAERFLPGAYAIKRYGEPGAREVRVALGGR